MVKNNTVFYSIIPIKYFEYDCEAINNYMNNISNERTLT